MPKSQGAAEVIAQAIASLSELSDEERTRALRAITSYFGTEPMREGSSDTGQAPSVGSFSADRRPDVKDFVHEKEPRTDVERVACLAYYLAHYRDLPRFKTLDLTKLNTEAAQPKFSNASFASANAMKSGYLVPAEKGQRQLSAAGERFVEALPDRAGAREVMSSSRKRARKKPKSSRKRGRTA